MVDNNNSSRCIPSRPPMDFFSKALATADRQKSFSLLLRYDDKKGKISLQLFCLAGQKGGKREEERISGSIFTMAASLTSKYAHIYQPSRLCLFSVIFFSSAVSHLLKKKDTYVSWSKISCSQQLFNLLRIFTPGNLKP